MINIANPLKQKQWDNTRQVLSRCLHKKWGCGIDAGGSWLEVRMKNPHVIHK